MCTVSSYLSMHSASASTNLKYILKHSMCTIAGSNMFNTVGVRQFRLMWLQRWGGENLKYCFLGFKFQGHIAFEKPYSSLLQLAGFKIWDESTGVAPWFLLLGQFRRNRFLLGIGPEGAAPWDDRVWRRRPQGAGQSRLSFGHLGTWPGTSRAQSYLNCIEWLRVAVIWFAKGM